MNNERRERTPPVPDDDDKKDGRPSNVRVDGDASVKREPKDVGYGASHGYPPGHGGPTSPGDAPAPRGTPPAPPERSKE